jgi:hypothetical protein
MSADQPDLHEQLNPSARSASQVFATTALAAAFLNLADVPARRAIPLARLRSTALAAPKRATFSPAVSGPHIPSDPRTYHEVKGHRPDQSLNPSA